MKGFAISALIMINTYKSLAQVPDSSSVSAPLEVAEIEIIGQRTPAGPLRGCLLHDPLTTGVTVVIGI